MTGAKQLQTRQAPADHILQLDPSCTGNVPHSPDRKKKTEINADCGGGHQSEGGDTKKGTVEQSCTTCLQPGVGLEASRGEIAELTPIKKSGDRTQESP